MAQIRNYIKGQFETLGTVPNPVYIGQATGGNDFIKADTVLTNGFSDLILYTDSAGSSPVPNDDYGETTQDATATTKEADTAGGGSGKVVYTQYKVTNATYIGVDLYATFTNFGTYTDNDAPFEQIGQGQTFTASDTVTPGSGAISTWVTADTSLGNVTLTLSDGEFVGQRIEIECDGSGLAYIKGTGVYVDASAVGVPVSDGLMFRAKWNGSAWKAVNEVTADYVSGTYDVAKTSGGKQVLVETVTISVTVGGYTGGSAFPSSFANNVVTEPSAHIVSSHSLHALGSLHPNSFGRSSIPPADYRTTYNYIGVTGSATSYSSNIKIKYEGPY